MIKKFLKNSKTGKYIIAGSFFFFLIKGLIWLIIIALAWLGVGKL
ncbi:hypothetical protein N9U57_01460 [Candidatus Pelagibacter sp.]|nr:hypothetical protein [Candidatus Pelagibacter sp.]